MNDLHLSTNNFISNGFYTKPWNGLDQLGRPVASGVYFSELRTRNFRKTKKMMQLSKKCFQKISILITGWAKEGRLAR